MVNDLNHGGVNRWWSVTGVNIQGQDPAPSWDISCVPLSCFFSNGGGVLVSGDVTVSAEASLPFSCDTQSKPTWWGHAATVLNGMRWGAVSGTSDYSKVTQSNSPNTPSTASTRDCTWTDGNRRYSQFHSLFVGVSGGTHIAKFKGPNSNRGSAAEAGESVSKSWDGTNAVGMAYLDEGICYLTYLAGDFHTVNDKAWIARVPVPNTSPLRYRWYLQTAKASSNNSTSGIRAHARCYLCNQNQ